MFRIAGGRNSLSRIGSTSGVDAPVTSGEMMREEETGEVSGGENQAADRENGGTVSTSSEAIIDTGNSMLKFKVSWIQVI